LLLTSEHTTLWLTRRAKWIFGWINSAQCVASYEQMTVTHQVMLMYSSYCVIAVTTKVTCTKLKEGLIQSCHSYSVVL